MRIRKSLNKQGGFSLAEVLMAGLILSIALIPMMGMFDASFKGMRILENIQRSIVCSQAAMERVRALPFYEPHDDTNQDSDFDIDDYFWGDRNPVGYNPANLEGEADWENIPEVIFYDYGAFASYEQYKVTVQLCYLEDDTGVATMMGSWGPKVMGNDRPTNADNKPLHLLLVRINVYWGESDAGHYDLESVVTDTEAIYNIGVSGITVTGPESITNPDRPNAAAHWSDPNVDVEVTIEGYGFDDVNDDDGWVEAYLVRDKYNDIPIDLTYRSETELNGRLTLYTGHNESNNTWSPKAAIGYWSVKVHQKDVVSAYLYEGFVVEYPKPVIDDFGNDADYSKTGDNNMSNAVLKFRGGPFCNIAQDPAVMLLQLDGEGNTVYQIDGNVTDISVPAGTYGYASSPDCVITAEFDFTSAPPGDYHAMVVNTEDPSMIGHRASDLSAAVYTILDVYPEVDDVFVYETMQHEAPGNVGNPWRLTFSGRYFNTSGDPAVEMYLCSQVVDDQPAGDFVQGVVVTVTTNVAVADFDLSSLPEGFYKGYLVNLNNGRTGWTSGAPFEVTVFNANIGSFVPDSGYNFYENYYDIPSKITGNGFLSATGVSIVNGAVEYDLSGEYTITGDNEIAVNLNLIGCSNTDAWKVRVYFGSDFYLERDFDVALGPAVILPPSDSKYAIGIYAQRGLTDQWNYETTSTRAYAWSGSWFIIWFDGYATFQVKGMGFPMNGQTNLRVWGSGLDVNGNFNCTYDRSAKIVQIESSRWRMPRNTSGLYNIEVYRVGDSAKDTHIGRWELRS